MLQQLLQGQAKGSLEMNNKLVEIHSKLESLTSRVQIIESSSASSSSPQEYAQAVTLRSGRQFPVEKRTDKANSSQPAKPVAKKKDTPAGPPPYKPPLPFPGRFKKQLLEAHKAKFDELMRQLELKLPFIDALMLIPPYQKFLKDAVQQRTREAQGMVVLTRECSAIIQRKVISDKKEDPGSFTLPCMLGPLSFKNSLCDLGSSVSLMPLSVAKRLGYHKYQACGISLVLADRSIRLPTGMLEDLPLRIGNVEIPTDFIVLEMDEEPTDPLILGRPFLATARAMIDVCEGTIELNLGKDLKMKFDIKDTMRKPTIEGFFRGYVSSETDEYKKLLDTFRPVPNILSIEGLDRPVCEVMALSALLVELRKYRKAIGYTLDDIKGISPDLCIHRIHLEDESKSSIEPQRRLNPNLKEVVKKEILKLLDAGIIYPISDSTWISPVHCVPKKGGITVIKNDKEELIPTRTIVGHRMCIDYRKLNSASRKDHFPLPFIDQMLERLHDHYPWLINGVSEDAIKLRLFPMSLADKAHQWEKSLPHGTITTWDECKKAFLAKFFSTGRTAKLRGEISSFIQRNNETFAEAWERFKGYTSQCPHHGFNNESLLSTLYRGCLPRYREMLDTASNGNFLNQDVDDGWQLVENIANSNGSYGEEYDRTNRSSTHHSIESDEKLRKDVKALNEKLDKLILAQSTMKKVNFVSAEEMEPVQEGEDTQFAEVCYMSNGQGGYNKGYYNYKSNPAMSYRNTDVANPQDQVYPQQQAARSSQVPQHGYGQKNNYQGPQGTFPGQQMNIPPGFPHQPPQPAPSQENELKAMLKQLLQGQADGVVDTSKKLAEINSKIENSTQGFTLWRIMLLLLLLLQSKDNYLRLLLLRLLESRLINQKCRHLLWPFTLHQLSSHNKLDRQLDRVRPLLSQNLLLDPYQPVAASSSRLLSQGHKEVIHKFRRDLSGIGIELPPMDSMSEAFDQMQMVKDVLANSDKVSEVLQESTHQFNLLTSPTFLPKVKDQGKFTLPCTLGHLEIDNALVDSGASINLISLSMAEKLGIAGALQRPTTSIMFGDATSKSPLGVFKNYHLKIGECIIQTDLTVMEMEEEKDYLCYWEPLSLPRGSDFCATIDSTTLSSKSHGATKVVKERVDKEPRVGKDKD
ncbi:unnamed protein product [Microthlaspi erraticum]|uniref:Retrotransposon gag domain-containing protein n=1 Tax=Microthlaspi erraticum TaxID=1685480 RepID=A0A6D2KNZ2_9BRAS|nr:unnamed protein product [Microthlaspi erraticum]